MPWKGVTMRDRRIEFVVAAKSEGQNFSALCRDFGISRPTGYLWLQRYEEVGCLDGLQEKSRRPHASPKRVAGAIEAEVVRLRQRYGWGGRKLKRLLEREGVEVSESSIDRIIKRQGLVDEANRKQESQRFVMSQPNELWQMDFKGQFPMQAKAECYPLTLLDDYSRYSLGIFALSSTALLGVQQSLVKVFHRYGLPQAMLMDHGTPWWSTTNPYGLTRLSVFLIQQGIVLKYSGIGHPQTQGKIERFHRSLKRSIRQRGYAPSLRAYQRSFNGFRQEYNHLRPHESLNMETPASRYQGSLREYEPRPRPWDYEEAEVRCLNTQGCLEYKGRRYFICEALASELVAVVEFDGKVLIKYRQMYIRELNLRKATSLPIVRPVYPMNL